MRKLAFVLSIIICCVTSLAQQINIPRIEQMPNLPQPYTMRNWKQVAIDYDNLVFNTSLTGDYLPLTTIDTNTGINYSSVHPIIMDTYIGDAYHLNRAEGINVLPAIVGATLVGVDKTNHLGTNWVQKVKEYFNRQNGQNVFLNGYNTSTGKDWWYEVMPNVFFYQLYALYPDVDADFASQFITVANRKKDMVFALGANVQPWTTPNFNYRAFNLLTGTPNTTSVPEPETAGSVAWLLYQAYLETQDSEYLQAAELALDFLNNWTANPSYEIQLPYGIAVAARMNAEEGTNYNIDKMLNWTFSAGKNTLRGWGTIVDTWGGYDVSGLIGEANENGNDYAFVMNGFQHAAALAPVAKYDKRYARAIGKWLLNVANASRLYYANALPDDKQHTKSNTWSTQYDIHSCIPYEAMKQVYSGKSPYLTGDAVRGGWASTNLSLYSGSSVGYLAGIINTTNIEGILQIDLNKTDFRGENLYPTYLYYNPLNSTQSVKIALPPDQDCDLYDAISETILQTKVSGSTYFDIPADAPRIIVVIPAGKSKQTQGRIRKIFNGGVIDWHYKNNYTNPLRIKSFSADKMRTISFDAIDFVCQAENITGTASYQWYINDVLVSTTSVGNWTWTAPENSGVYKAKVSITANHKTLTSSEINITIAPLGSVEPTISNLEIIGNNPFAVSSTASIHAAYAPADARFEWSCSRGILQNENTLNPVWNLPSTAGIYTLRLTVTNILGSITKEKQILVKELQPPVLTPFPLVYYDFNGNTQNVAVDAYHAVSHGAVLTNDALGNPNRAYSFANGDFMKIVNDNLLNFTDKITISLWIKPDQLPNREQFVVSHGSWEERYKMSITPERFLRWTVKTAEGIVDVDDPNQLQINEFVHYVGLYSGYSLELYRNGTFVAYKALNGAMGTTSHNITFARKDENDTNYTFNGTIDEVRIYNTDLDPNTIQKLPDTWDIAVGVTHVDSDMQIQVAPNPIQNYFIVKANEQYVNFVLVNLQGQIVFSKNNVYSGETVQLLDIAPGIYLLKIIENEVIKIVKLQKM